MSDSDGRWFDLQQRQCRKGSNGGAAIDSGGEDRYGGLEDGDRSPKSPTKGRQAPRRAGAEQLAHDEAEIEGTGEIGRASCRERG